jgi:hypothetical protein
MFKKFRLPLLLVLGAVLTVLTPSTALAKNHDHDRGRRHHSRFSFYFGVAPRRYAVPPPRYYPNGYFDQWGYWHPYGYYDAWGYWHPY